MKLTADPCKVIHLKRNDFHFSYTLLGSKLAAATQEKDLGITVDISMKLIMQQSLKSKQSAEMNKEWESKYWRNYL